MVNKMDARRIGLGILVTIFVAASLILWTGARNTFGEREPMQPDSSAASMNAESQSDEDIREIEAYLCKEMLVGDFEHDAGWAARQWGRNPFLTSGEIRFFDGASIHTAGGRTEEVSNRPEPKAKIVLISGDRRVALLEDGKFVSIGDRIESELVAKIDIDGVVLADKHGTRRIDLPQSSITIAGDATTTE